MSSRRANPRLIGGFVIGGIGLLVAAALVFGRFTFFETTQRFVVFLEGSVDGLTVGSPVLFRGVPLGQVVEVGVRYDPADKSFEIPVIIQIRPDVIQKYSPPAALAAGLKQLIDQGLRARLESASLVTGSQVVQLNFYPGTPVKLVKTDLPYYQIPALPSPTQELMSSVETAGKNLPTLIKEGIATLDRIQKIVSPENEKTISTILERAASMMKSLEADAASIGPVIGRADDALAGVHQLTGHLDGVVQENREDIRASLRNFRQATASADKLMDQLNGVAAENRRPIRQFTEGSLPDLSALIIDARTAVGKATTILDSIDRNPARFLFGNKMEQGVQLR
ncbi:MAG TPA: MlaD family protein [Stellaceae bacterium]|nr:MlaD family protein [Stellaceae bacterium]